MLVTAYEGQLVHQADAARMVVPMPESGDEASSTRFEPAAYATRPPALYRYRQDAPGGTHVGLVCAVDVAGFADGRVRGHEQVLPARVDALATHLSRGDARIELVTAIHEAGPHFLAATVGAEDPLIDVTTADGSRHRVWPVPPEPALLGEMAAVRHYLADGHHRVAASLRLWEQAGRPAGHTMAVVSYALDGLRLEAHPGSADREIPDLRRVVELADAGQTVAPKTTYFRPKPASGLFVR